MKRLFVSDLDDTLVENGKKLPEHTIKELNRIFKNNEKEFVIASARNYDAIKRRTKGLERNIKIIARNGTIIYDESGAVISSFYIGKEEVKKAIKYSIVNKLCPVVIEMKDDKEIFYTNKRYFNDEIVAQSNGLNLINNDNLENECFNSVIDIYAFGKIQKENNFNLAGVKIIKDTNFIHFVGKNVDKGHALKELNKIYKYDNITCFGNDENDYPMLDYCENPYYIYKDVKNNKYNNLPFDNGVSIFKIMEK